MFKFGKKTKKPETHSKALAHHDTDDAPTTTTIIESKTEECPQSQTDTPSCTSNDKVNKNGAEEVSQMPLSSSEAPLVDHGNEQQHEPFSIPTSTESSSPTHSPLPLKESTSPSLPSVAPSLLTWDEALYQACVKNKTFLQTPRQVLHQHHHVLRPRQDLVLLSTQTDVAMQIGKKLSSPPTTTNSSTSMTRAVWNQMTFIASQVYQYTIADPDDYTEQDLENSLEQNDDAHETRLVDWNDSIVSVQLVVECLEQLREQLGDIFAVRKSGTKTHSFATFVAQHSTIGVQQPRDLHLLQQVLMESGHAQVSGDFLILGEHVPTLTETNVQVAVSLTQLQEAIEACHDLNEKRQVEIEKHTRLAAEKKRTKDSKGALRELQLCKLLRTKVDSTSAHLLNLHQAHDSLQSAHFQATRVMKPLEDTAAALKALRQEVPLERVDDVMLDLQEELEHVNYASERMASSSGIQANDFDEDELLAELEQMTLQDNDIVEHDSSRVKKKENGVEPQARSNPEEKEEEILSDKVSTSTGFQDVAHQVSSDLENDGGVHDTKETVAATPAL